MRERLPPLILQAVGLLGLVGMAVFWGFTDRLSPTLLAAMGSLVGAGTYINAVTSLPDVRVNDTPPDDAGAQGQRGAGSS